MGSMVTSVDWLVCPLYLINGINARGRLTGLRQRSPRPWGRAWADHARLVFALAQTAHDLDGRQTDQKHEPIDSFKPTSPNKPLDAFGETEGALCATRGRLGTLNILSTANRIGPPTYPKTQRSHSPSTPAKKNHA